MWSADILLGLLGVYLTIRIGKESVVIDWSFFKRFVPGRLRQRFADDKNAQATAP
jgi:hypothetical protein